MSTLQGKVALVTGASSGIGAGIARRLAADGAIVAVNHRIGSAEAAQALVGELRADGTMADAFLADVGVPSECDAMVAAVADRFGRLDVLVNNAGITRDGLLVRMSDEDWQAVIETNLSGAFYCCRAAGKLMMKARGGSIINIASVIGLVGNAGQSNYAAAKAGIIGLTKSIAKELASRGVRANVIAPGFIETPMTAKLSEALREASMEVIAMRRFGSVDDVAAAVSFLASDDAAYITGQVLAVDGGMTFV